MNLSKYMNKRLLVVFVLGFSSGLPLALISTTLQAWFAAAGLPILATGMLSLISLPYLYRVVWGPILDRYSLSPMGKRRSWIFFMQLFLLVGFNLMAWFSPATSPQSMALFAFVLACFSATQDIAIDAQRTEYLPIEEHGLGASLAVLGYRLALLVAGGLALIIAEYSGFPAAYRVMGLLMLPGMLAVVWSEEPVSKTVSKVGLVTSFVAPVQELVSRPGVIPLLFFVFLYKLGEAFTTTTSGILMPFLIQGLGFSLGTIAYVNKMMGVGAILLGGLAAGFLLLRWSLYRALLVFGLLQAATNVLFVLLAMVGKSLPLFMLAVVSDNFAVGMGSTALVALLMRMVDRRFTATQFSILVALSTLPRILSGPFAALLESQFGWTGLYQIASLLALGFIPFLMLIRQTVEAAQVESLCSGAATEESGELRAMGE